MLTQIGYTDPMPCRVENCGEPFVDFGEKLCVEHHMELREIEQQDNKDEATI